MFKKYIGAILVLLTVLLAAGCETPTGPQTTDDPGKTGPFTVKIKEISKHGNALLDVTFDGMKAAGLEIGDVITVTVGEKKYDLPIGTSYTDVDSGEMICRFDTEDSVVALAINMGSFADVTGAGRKETLEEDPGYKWTVLVPEVELALKEKKGYLDEYNARNLTRTNVRADYSALSDEAFANFRAVAVSGLKENFLYRSSSPVEPALARNEYVMAAMERAGIRTVLNLDDSVETMTAYPAYPGSYYSKCSVVNPEMNYDFTGAEFGEKVKESLLFIIENDGPYLIHCKEGKDRTGILCAVLECFAGASAEEVERDYMLTYFNYYGVQPQDAAYGIVLKNNLVKTLCGLYQVDGLASADLKKEAEEYLLSVGLSEVQLNELAEKLTVR